MKCRTTRSSALVPMRKAIESGLAPDGGLFMPETIPEVVTDLRRRPPALFSELAYRVLGKYLDSELPDAVIRSLCSDAFSFPVKRVVLSPDLSVLELFHGPTLAFKDFGARFLARSLAAFRGNDKRRQLILVATSGDTGSAVADGFLGLPGIDVAILYPSGKVSPLQELQFTTLGANIIPLEVKGTFDDCQRIVKDLLLDERMSARRTLASANSINIARLLPQSLYYLWTAMEFGWRDDVTFITPSGNFGNLTAGVLAQRMGMPAKRFIAATNINDVVPRYLRGEGFIARPSVQTISNAMDVGNPSNFERLLDLFQGQLPQMASTIGGHVVTDQETRRAMQEVYQRFGYIADPHTATGLHAALELNPAPCVVLGTAHPAKFPTVVQESLQITLAVPENLARYRTDQRRTIVVNADTEAVAHQLLSRLP